MTVEIQNCLSVLIHQCSSDKFRELFNCLYFNKPIRVEISVKDIERINHWANKLHLHFTSSNKSFRLLNDNGMDNWQSTIEYCDEGEIDAMKFVYLHSEIEVCERAKQLDEKGDDFSLGFILNYPDCCVNAFLNWQQTENEIDPITVITNSLSISEQLPTFDFPNPFVRYFGSGLISHFPCSLNCKATKQIAFETLSGLKNNFPYVAERIVELENSIVLFTKGKGISLWTSFTATADQIKVDRNSFHGQGEMKSIYSRINEIKITSKEVMLFSNKNELTRFERKSVFIGAFNISPYEKYTFIKNTENQPAN